MSRNTFSTLQSLDDDHDHNHDDHDDHDHDQPPSSPKKSKHPEKWTKHPEKWHKNPKSSKNQDTTDHTEIHKTGTPALHQPMIFVANVTGIYSKLEMLALHRLDYGLPKDFEFHDKITTKLPLLPVALMPVEADHDMESSSNYFQRNTGRRGGTRGGTGGRSTKGGGRKGEIGWEEDGPEKDKFPAGKNRGGRVMRTEENRPWRKSVTENENDIESTKPSDQEVEDKPPIKKAEISWKTRSDSPKVHPEPQKDPTNAEKDHSLSQSDPQYQKDHSQPHDHLHSQKDHSHSHPHGHIHSQKDNSHHSNADNAHHPHPHPNSHHPHSHHGHLVYKPVLHNQESSKLVTPETQQSKTLPLEQTRESQDQEPQNQEPQNQKPQNQKPQNQKPQNQEPQNQEPQNRKPQNQELQNQEPQPQRQNPQNQKLQDQEPQNQLPQNQTQEQKAQVLQTQISTQSENITSNDQPKSQPPEQTQELSALEVLQRLQNLQKQAQMSTLWYYKDPKGQERGPFASEQIEKWLDRNYFKPDLLIRKDGDKNYSTLANLFIQEQKNPFSMVPLQQWLVPPLTDFKASFMMYLQNQQIQEQQKQIQQQQLQQLLSQFKENEGAPPAPIFGPIKSNSFPVPVLPLSTTPLMAPSPLVLPNPILPIPQNPMLSSSLGGNQILPNPILPTPLAPIPIQTPQPLPQVVPVFPAVNVNWNLWNQQQTFPNQQLLQLQMLLQQQQQQLLQTQQIQTQKESQTNQQTEEMDSGASIKKILSENEAKSSLLKEEDQSKLQAQQTTVKSQLSQQSQGTQTQEKSPLSKQQTEQQTLSKIQTKQSGNISKSPTKPENLSTTQTKQTENLPKNQSKPQNQPQQNLNKSQSQPKQPEKEPQTKLDQKGTPVKDLGNDENLQESETKEEGWIKLEKKKDLSKSQKQKKPIPTTSAPVPKQEAPKRYNIAQSPLEIYEEPTGYEPPPFQLELNFQRLQNINSPPSWSPSATSPPLSLAEIQQLESSQKEKSKEREEPISPKKELKPPFNSSWTAKQQGDVKGLQEIQLEEARLKGKQQLPQTAPELKPPLWPNTPVSTSDKSLLDIQEEEASKPKAQKQKPLPSLPSNINPWQAPAIKPTQVPSIKPLSEIQEEEEFERIKNLKNLEILEESRRRISEKERKKEIGRGRGLWTSPIAENSQIPSLLKIQMEEAKQKKGAEEKKVKEVIENDGKKETEGFWDYGEEESSQKTKQKDALSKLKTSTKKLDDSVFPALTPSAPPPVTMQQTTKSKPLDESAFPSLPSSGPTPKLSLTSKPKLAINDKEAFPSLGGPSKPQAQTQKTKIPISSDSAFPSLASPKSPNSKIPAEQKQLQKQQPSQKQPLQKQPPQKQAPQKQAPQKQAPQKQAPQNQQAPPTEQDPPQKPAQRQPPQQKQTNSSQPAPQSKPTLPKQPSQQTTQKPPNPSLPKQTPEITPQQPRNNQAIGLPKSNKQSLPVQPPIPKKQKKRNQALDPNMLGFNIDFKGYNIAGEDDE